MVISTSSAEASNEPCRLPNMPRGMLGEMCRAKAASGAGPSSRPSSIMWRAPCQPSSPGWNMNITVPASRSRSAQSACAAPTSMATWVSWPQACIAPSMRERKSRPVSSFSGRASMSPRSSTVRPLSEPRRMAIRPVVDGPSRISSGSPASAARILALVLGQCRPSSGSSWIDRRRRIASASRLSPASVQSVVSSAEASSIVRISPR